MPTRSRLGSRLLPAVLASAVVALTACGGDSVDDPESARCQSPSTTFGQKVVLGDHTEVDVHFRCNGATLAGTLHLPKKAGRHPVVIYVHGAGEATRWTWSVPWVKDMVDSGFAFFSYDKRGVGKSEGECCPGDDNHFNLLAADADGAVNALRSRPEINPTRIGFLGLSQAGWIVPLAVVRSQHRVAFSAIVSGPATTTHEEQQWSDLAGEDEDNPPALTKQAKADFEQQLDPSGFDPLPLIRQMDIPAIWLYGGQDRSEPADKSAAILKRLPKGDGKDFTVVTFPNAGHGLLDTPPTDPRAITTLVAWLRDHALSA
jgi:uncharacterized protein